MDREEWKKSKLRRSNRPDRTMDVQDLPGQNPHPRGVNTLIEANYIDISTLEILMMPSAASEAEKNEANTLLKKSGSSIAQITISHPVAARPGGITDPETSPGEEVRGTER